MGVPEKPVLIVGAGVSGLVLAQYLRKTGVPFRLFERDADLATRGLGWGLTLHWSLPALRALLPPDLFQRLPEAYVDRAAVDAGRASTFPFFDLSTGELKASTPTAPESSRIRVNRDRFRRLLATGLDIQACDDPCCEGSRARVFRQGPLTTRRCCFSGAAQSAVLTPATTEPSPSVSTTARPATAVSSWRATAAARASGAPWSPTCPTIRSPCG